MPQTVAFVVSMIDSAAAVVGHELMKVNVVHLRNELKVHEVVVHEVGELDVRT